MTRRPMLGLIGIAVFVASVLPPFDDAAARLFAVHMIQHMVMILVAAPMIAASQLFPIRTRLLRSAIAVVVLQAVVLWAWHMPVIYDAAMRSQTLHILEHISFVVTGVLFWNFVLDRAIDPLKRVAVVFVTMLHSAALGALIAFASRSLYEWHDVHTPAGYDVLGQQQAAGAIMWIPPGVIYLAVMLALLWRLMSIPDTAEQS